MRQSRLLLVVLVAVLRSVVSIQRLRRRVYTVVDDTKSILNEFESRFLVAPDPEDDGEAPPEDAFPVDMSFSMSMSMPSEEIWRFRVVAGVHDQTADEYGGLEAIETKIRDQFQVINSRFRSDFDKPLVFDVTDVYGFDTNQVAENFKPIPDHDVRVVYDGFPEVGGGWYGDFQSIHHSWPVDSFGGPFAEYATDGLVHEFAHSRGCLDLYFLEVRAAENPVNGEAFDAPDSIMTYPFGETIWDTHCIHTINSNTDKVPATLDILRDSWPPQLIFRATAQDGSALEGVSIQLYRVPYFPLYIVDPTPDERFRYTTDASGEVVLDMESKNPFEPGVYNGDFGLFTGNFLVEFSRDDGSPQKYEWLPFWDIQNAQVPNPGSKFEVEAEFSN